MNNKLTLPLRVGLVGCGNISDAYFQQSRAFADTITITACASRTVARARGKAAQYGLRKGCSVKELLADDEIDLVLNLTNPLAHAEICLQALRAGKAVYCEKPFTATVSEARRVLQEAARRGLSVGCAPDTVLGAGIQTCRKLIDSGAIGRPVAAAANMLNHGSEHWHPNPAFFYQPGGGPLFGAGPYYLGALVTLLGPVRRVSAMSGAAFKQRHITSEPLRGKKIRVQTPTHWTGQAEFAQGAVASVSMSFDVWAHHQPPLEIYGTEGSLQCPDPNRFDGEVLLWTRKSQSWQSVPLLPHGAMGRSLGMAEMALAMRKGRAPRAGGELALHVVDIMESFGVSARTGRRVLLKSDCQRPAALVGEL